MKPIFESDDVKGSFFLSTLPDTLDHVIDNFSTRDITRFSAMEPKILDIADKYTLDTDTYTAYSAQAPFRRPRGSPAPRGGSQSSTQRTPNPIWCTWCKKHNFDYTGHVFRDCHLLHAHKQGLQGGQEEDKDTNKGKEKLTDDVQHAVMNFAITGDSSDSDGAVEVTAF
ncbi:hypothetical protein BU26DRAFT_178542 [Trematosphaeria pertusa]|uniref:Uncharacterized protein n=1 Tax=Trematosphaeria pertusa TaxID=390896 RepID=A0A6A6HTW2_9PLEO|nr:uncharacterized protein BU26DRAFT_178542 [Trematosphaeria pertusa]KAF2241467.1 hypothetical protein BU26DRAFT_178542 [Trematosphaeria pertusa]